MSVKTASIDALPRHGSYSKADFAVGHIISFGVQVQIRDLLAPVRFGLEQVEAKMQTVENSLFAPLATAFVDLIGSGGKRIRPALALMAAEFGRSLQGTPEYVRVVAIAAAVEMLHTATLVHDDVIDGALLRRGAPTLNSSWSQGATVLAGDYMVARAAELSAETDNMRVITIFSDTLNTIVNGELRQIFARNDYYQDKEGYYQRIYAKTASLFSAATESAAVLSALPEASIQHLKDFGYNLGMAFQIVDDILDFTSSEDSLGKPAGSDLRQGTLTLPFFYFLQAQPNPELLMAELDEVHELAEEAEAEGRTSPAWNALVDRLVTEVRTNGAVGHARQEADLFLMRARDSLRTLPDNVYKQSMLSLCDFVVQRTY